MSALKKTIHAVHVSDLEAVLARLGLADAFRSGSLRCPVCADVITLENAGSIKFTDGRPSLVCSKIPCYGEIVKAIME